MATAPQFFEWDHIKEAVDFATDPRNKMITTPEAEAVFELLHDNIPLMSRLRRDLRHTTNRKYVHVMNYLSRMENSTFGIMMNKEVDSLEDTVTNCQNMLREQLRLKSVEVKVDLLRQKHALKDAIDDVTKKFEAVHEDLDKRVNSVAKILNKVKDEPVVVITNAEESSETKRLVAKELGNERHDIPASDLVKILSVIKTDDLACEILHGLIEDEDGRFKDFAMELISQHSI